MNNKKKIISFIICAIFVMSSFCVYAESINVDLNKITIKVNGEEAKANNILYNDRTYVPLRAISEMLSKKVLWDEQTKTVDINDISGMIFKGHSIGKMGKLDILSDEYKLFEEISKTKGKISSDNTTPTDEEIKSNTENLIKKYKASLMIMEENNLSFPDNMNEDFDNSFNNTNEYYKSQGLGENAFLELIKFMGYSYDSYKFESQINKANSLISSHFSKNFSDEELRSYYDLNKNKFKSDMVQAKHILLLTEGKSEDEIKETEKKMNDILKKIKNGENFDKLMEEFCEDPGVKQNPDGYIFGKGEMVKEFEEAAFNLKNNGDVSDVIKSSYGYHIIKLVDKFDTIPFDKSKSSINTLLNTQNIEKIIEEKINSCDFSLDTTIIDKEISSDEIFNPGNYDIDAALNSVNINVNGVKVDGENIIYMGRTYVPLRKVSEMLSKEILWDTNTNTADIVDNYGVVFVSEEEEIDTYKNIIKSENQTLDEQEVISKAKEQMDYDRKVIAYANSLGIKADKSLLDEYKSYVSSIKSQLSQTGDAEKAYQMMLESMGYTEKSIMRIFEVDFYNQKLFDKLFEELKPSETDINDFYNKNKEKFVYDGIRVKHILIYTIDDYGNPLGEEEIKEKKEIIDNIYNKAKSGEDFQKLMNEYSDDETISDYPDGYTIKKGDMIKEFEDAAFSLENIGDICEPFLSKYGYHIIKLEEKVPYYSLSDKDFYSYLEQIIATEKLKEKIKNYSN